MGTLLEAAHKARPYGFHNNCPGYFNEGKVEGAKLAYDRET